MECGIEKCAILVIEKGKIVKSVGIEFPDGEVIESLQKGENYKACARYFLSNFYFFFK